MLTRKLGCLLGLIVFLTGCIGVESPVSGQPPVSDVVETQLVEGSPDPVLPISYADVISVEVTGHEKSYQLSVGIQSPDKGCEQFADWWEVLSPDEQLLYRRILLHSHVGEQPFIRSGGPVVILPDQTVLVRAHMNTSRYGGQAFQGSVADGFAPYALTADFAASLETQSPLPKGCDF